jgi:regulator of RNase E activity RraA
MSSGNGNLAGIAAGFGGVYTSLISDVLDELGFPDRALPPEIVQLAPGMRLAGPAFPCFGRPQRGMPYDESMRRMLDWLDAVPAGSVALYKTDDDKTAQFGDLSAARLVARGCAGVVIDGGTRDTDQVLRTGLPVFARYRTPIDCLGRWELLGWGEPVTVGGVEVNPGDYLVGDDDGVMVIPAHLRDEVLRRTQEMVETEVTIRAGVEAGTLTPIEAYEQYGIY